MVSKRRAAGVRAPEGPGADPRIRTRDDWRRDRASTSSPLVPDWTPGRQAVSSVQAVAGNRAVAALIQTKLMVGAADDPYEREADRVADRIMRALTSGAAWKGAPGADEPVRRSTSVENALGAAFEADAGIARRLTARRGGGRALPDAVRARMEPAFGADFSGVRIHVDREAAGLSESIQARAFTHGSDIYFGTGGFAPSSRAGQHLLAHELTHVVQQAGGRRLQRTPIDLKQIGAFLEKSRDARRARLEDQSPKRLQMIADFLEERRRSTSSRAERMAIDETLEDIAETLGDAQEADVTRLGRGAGNWANVVLLADGKAVANVSSQKSGLTSGKKTRWGMGGKGKKKEILISHNDSEATVFNMLERQVDWDRLRGAAQSLVLNFVSTNGACDGCKGRINEFVNSHILPLAGQGVAVSMRYRYTAPSKDVDRGIPTTYGWPGDAKIGNLFEHITTYRT
jgi:hypothetical protein